MGRGTDLVDIIIPSYKYTPWFPLLELLSILTIGYGIGINHIRYIMLAMILWGL